VSFDKYAGGIIRACCPVLWLCPQHNAKKCKVNGLSIQICTDMKTREIGLKIEVLKTVTVTNKLREATVLIHHRAVLPSLSP